jgi:hypothetical protein
LAVQDQQICGAAACKSRVGAVPVGLYDHGRSQIFAANVNGGQAAITERLRFNASHNWWKLRTSAAASQRARHQKQGQPAPCLKEIEKGTEMDIEMVHGLRVYTARHP